MKVNFRFFIDVAEKEKSKDDVALGRRLNKKLIEINSELAQIGLNKLHIDSAPFDMLKRERLDLYHRCNSCYHDLKELIQLMNTVNSRSVRSQVMHEFTKIMTTAVSKMDEMLRCMIRILDKNGFQARSEIRLGWEIHESDLPNTEFHEAMLSFLDSGLDDAGVSDAIPDECYSDDDYENDYGYSYAKNRPKMSANLASNLKDKPKEPPKQSSELDSEDLSMILSDFEKMENEKKKAKSSSNSSSQMNEEPSSSSECASQVVGRKTECARTPRQITNSQTDNASQVSKAKKPKKAN